MKEFCLICSSANHINLGNEDVAWECWNCHERYWVDDMARIEYMAYTGVDYEQAERDLKDGKVAFSATQSTAW